MSMILSVWAIKCGLKEKIYSPTFWETFNKKDSEKVDTSVITVISTDPAKIFFSQLSLKSSNINPINNICPTIAKKMSGTRNHLLAIFNVSQPIKEKNTNNNSSFFEAPKFFLQNLSVIHKYPK